MRLVCGQQIVSQPPRHGGIAHAAIGQQHLDEQRPAAGQRGLDRQLHRGDFADERRGQERREIGDEERLQPATGRSGGQLQDGVRREGGDGAKVLAQEAVREKPAGMTRPVRWYVITFGPWNHLALEAEFETLAECERLMAEWLANLSPEFWKKWQEVMDQGGSNEIWTILE